MKRPILCRLGFHKIEPDYYMRIKKRRGSHKWHRNYAVCCRCGRLVFTLKKEARK